ncbi:helix-turn-helix transcriptional regulator [Deefgea piscis]|uniref:helix-turn-helix transcriptional regulator n=1 Tax=Deefgea piscis TaxID=2739061 RepID=UPI001C7E5B15|nr:AraC family transcriptional regulator [Deefgea piscis]QZA81700.1 helix-turn-helix transcriptional regulator [Deefgea piscis]
MPALHTKQIKLSQIQAKSTQSLRQICCLQPMLMRVRQGEKHLFIGEQHFIARVGDLVIAPAGLEVTLRNQADHSGYACDVVLLDPQLIARCRQQYPEVLRAALQQPAQLCVKLDPWVAMQWDQLFQASDVEPTALQHHRAVGLLLALTMAGQGQAIFIDKGDSISQRVQQLLLLHTSKPWTVEQMAQQLHLGASTLRRQLMQEGNSFRRLLEQVRLNTALGMIQTTSHSIGDIAQQCGYASASRFSSRFSQQFGVKPLQLRATVTSDAALAARN